MIKVAFLFRRFCTHVFDEVFKLITGVNFRLLNCGFLSLLCFVFFVLTSSLFKKTFSSTLEFSLHLLTHLFGVLLSNLFNLFIGQASIGVVSEWRAIAVTTTITVAVTITKVKVRALDFLIRYLFRLRGLSIRITHQVHVHVSSIGTASIRSH